MFHNASPVLRASSLLTFWQNRLSQHPKKQKSPDGAPKILEGTIWWKKCPTSRYGTFNPSFYPIGLMYAIFPYNNSTLPYKPAKCGKYICPMDPMSIELCKSQQNVFHDFHGISEFLWRLVGLQDSHAQLQLPHLEKQPKLWRETKNTQQKVCICNHTPWNKHTLALEK